MQQRKIARLKKTGKICLFLAPAVLLAAAFSYGPLLRTVIHSLSYVNAKGAVTGFAGLENFTYVLGRSDFKKALMNTLVLTAVNVPVTLVLTLFLALLSERKRRLGFIYEVLFTLPMAVSMAAACMIFKAMFSPSAGIVNKALGLRLPWFTGKNTALLSCILLTVWMGIGFNYLLFLSALRTLPKGVEEAAALDGAGYLTRVFRIKLPLISPTIFYVICTNTVLAIMCSAPMIIITQGGPSRSTSTLIYMMYTSGFGSGNYGLAAVVALIAFLLTFGFTLVAFAAERKKVFYQ